MATRLKKSLDHWAADGLFDSKGDEERDARFYYIGGLDCLFPNIAKAAIADGISSLTVMKMLVSTAFEILDNRHGKPGEGRDIAALVVHEAQRLHSLLYPSQAEIEELKRDAAAFRASRVHH